VEISVVDVVDQVDRVDSVEISGVAIGRDELLLIRKKPQRRIEVSE
jgi:hypothetical protein